MEEAVREAVTKAVELIACAGNRAIKAHLESVVIKDAVKASLVIPRNDPQWHSLAEAQGRGVMVVVADVEDFDGERAPAAVLPDQAALFEGATVVHSDPNEREPVL